MTLLYNKKQEECIDQWRITLNAGWFDHDMLKQFLEEFTSIDPSPDPVTYKISVDNESPGNFRVVYSDIKNKEDAQDTLRRILKEIVVSRTVSAEFISMALQENFLQLRKIDNKVVTWRIDKE